MVSQAGAQQGAPGWLRDEGSRPLAIGVGVAVGVGVEDRTARPNISAAGVPRLLPAVTLLDDSRIPGDMALDGIDTPRPSSHRDAPATLSGGKIDLVPDTLRARGGPGCLGLIIGTVVLAAVIVVVFLVGFIALGVVIGLFIVGVLAVAVDRLLLALSPKRRQRRADRGAAIFAWQFGRPPPGQIIDTTAVESTPEPNVEQHVLDDPDLRNPGWSGKE